MLTNGFILSFISAAADWTQYAIIAALVIIIVLVAYITIKNNKDR